MRARRTLLALAFVGATAACRNDTVLAVGDPPGQGTAHAGSAQSGEGGAAGAQAGAAQGAGQGGATRTNDCMPVPHACGFPDATNTGVPAGTTLTQGSCDTITADNTVIDGKLFNCSLHIAAKGVTVKRSKIVADSYYALIVDSGSVSVEDSELSGGSAAVIAFDDWSCARCDIHDIAGDGSKLGSNVTLRDSYLHAFTGHGAHGSQLQNGVTDVVVRHNTIAMADPATNATAGNAALFIAPDLGPSSKGPLTVDDNLLSGGDYTVYLVDGNKGEYLLENITFTNNRVVKDSYVYGPVSTTDDEVPYITQHGNVYDQDGTPLP